MTTTDGDTRDRVRGLFSEYLEEKYANFTLNPLAAYALYKLDLYDIPTTFENVVVTTFLMFPKKFALIGYDEYPDAARINRTLLHLTPKYENWLSGNGSKGYVLNDKGIEEAKKVEEAIESGITESRKKKVSQPRIKFDTESRKIRGSSPFKKFSGIATGNIAKWEIYNLLGAFPYTPTRELRRRLSELITMAKDANDDEIVSFLNKIHHDFPEIFEIKYGEEGKK